MLKIEGVIEEIYGFINSGKKNGLENMKILMKTLGISQPDYKIIHVAGTNGKGSVSATLEHILFSAGFTVGKFTSPHILKISERIRLDETEISDMDFIEAYLEVKKAIELKELTPTFFEIMTAMMFYYFKDKNLDYLVLETGIGGRIDSTNIFQADFAVITNVGLDHVEMLGDNLASIAAEKAGIIKSGSQVIIGISEPELFEKVMAEDFNRVVLVEEKYAEASYRLDFENFLTRIEIKGKKFDFSLFGEHQFSNFLSAYEVLKMIGISDKVIAENCGGVYLQCRFEVVKRSPLIILDGAHNSHGINALKNTLMKGYEPSDITVITTVLKDKDIDEIAVHMEKLSENIILTSLSENKRGVSAEVLEKYFTTGRCSVEETLHGAIEKALKDHSKIIIICGSFYLLSKFKEECGYVWKDR